MQGQINELANAFWQDVETWNLPEGKAVYMAELHFTPHLRLVFKVYDVKEGVLTNERPVIVEKPAVKVDGMALLSGLAKAKAEGTMQEFARRFWQWAEAKELFFELLAKLEL